MIFRKKLKEVLILISLSSVILFAIARLAYKELADDANSNNKKATNLLLEDGDIIFQTSNSSQSKAIQIATNSKYSHVGIVYKIESSIYVYEAIQPVKLTPLDVWIERGQKGRFVVKRLKNANSILTPEIKEKMKTYGEIYLGKNYDFYFEWSDDRIYCSELVWKIFKNAVNIEIGKLEQLQNFNLEDKEVKKKLIERYGKNIPIKELVISPASIFNSEKLETIYEHN